MNHYNNTTTESKDYWQVEEPMPIAKKLTLFAGFLVAFVSFGIALF